MMRIVKTLCETQGSNEGCYDIVENLIASGLFEESEVILLTFVKDFYDNNSRFPSEEILLQQFQDISFQGEEGISSENIADLAYVVMDERSNLKQSRGLMEIARQVATTGLSDEHIDQLMALHARQIKSEHIGIDDIKALYEERKNKSTGPLTYCQPIDEAIVGCSPGTITVIAGRPGHGKTLWGYNIGYRNTIDRDENSLLISLETPKEEGYLYLAARHAYEMGYKIPHLNVRTGNLTPDVEELVFSTVLEDLKRRKGQIVILDEKDFKSHSFVEMEKIINYWDKEMEGGISSIIIDYIQLLMNSGGKSRDPKDVGNEYVTFFRRLAIRKKKTVIILAQTSRAGEKHAGGNGGKYRLSDLAELNFLEREAYRVLTIWSDDVTRASQRAKTCLLKNRGGPTLQDPVELLIIPWYYVAGSKDKQPGGISRDALDVFARQEQEEALSQLNVSDVY